MSLNTEKVLKTANMKEYQRNYYLNHSNELKNYANTPKYCIYCKKNVAQGYMAKHAKTEKHMLNYLFSHTQLS